MENPLRNLADLTSGELQKFLDSFDNVLCDCDGVLWMLHTPIGDTPSSVSTLKKLGKRVGALTNNTTLTLKDLHRQFEVLNFEIDADSIVYPTPSIIHYLKKIGFTKEVFVISSTVVKNEIANAGFKVAETGDPFVGESLRELVQKLDDNLNIGAVLFDLDFNFTYLKVAKASVYLHRPDVLYLIGASDKGGPLGLKTPVLGPGGMQEALEEFTGNQRIYLGKPGKEFSTFVNARFNVKNPSRTLIIGDSLEPDIRFAKAYGYQSLLVLSGTSSLEEAKSCAKETVPDFYIQRFADLHTIIKEKLKL